MNKVEKRITRTLCEVLALVTTAITVGISTPATAGNVNNDPRLGSNPYPNLYRRTSRTYNKYRGRAYNSLVNNPAGRTYLRYTVPVGQSIINGGNRVRGSFNNFRQSWINNTRNCHLGSVNGGVTGRVPTGGVLVNCPRR